METGTHDAARYPPFGHRQRDGVPFGTDYRRSAGRVKKSVLKIVSRSPCKIRFVLSGPVSASEQLPVHQVRHARPTQGTGEVLRGVRHCNEMNILGHQAGSTQASREMSL